MKIIKLSVNKSDLFAILFLTTLSLYVLKDMQYYLDIMAADDALYMYVGDSFPLNLLLVQYGPIYTSFIKLISLFCINNIQAYYLLILIMTILPTLTLYIFLRTFGKMNYIISILFSVLFFFSLENISLTIWSKISHFAISFIFLGLSYISFEKSTTRILIKACVLLFLLGYIRPEFHLGYYLLLIFTLGYIFYIKKVKITKPVFLKLGIFTLASMFVLLLYNPLKGGRSSVAFSQQFTFNYLEWNELSNYNFVNWIDIYENEFNGAKSIKSAIITSPKLFLEHITYNMYKYILKAFNAIKEIFFPSSLFSVKNISVLLFLILINILLINKYTL